LKIEKKELFESNYYRNTSPSEDIKTEKLSYEFFGQKTNICYLSYQKISSNMAKKYKEYLKQFIKEDDIVIIDLTNNSGGSLWSAAYFISFFFKKNTYLFSINILTKDKIKTQNFITSEDGPFVNNIVFVVQDDTTISSAEVISGVLKQKSLIFGDLSYGKPYIQSTLEVGNLIVTFTNAFLNFDLELKPHDKVKPDFFLSPKEIENKKIVEIVPKIVYYLRRQSFGG
jgi:C-terminal processing protease CtpA/Prc